MARRAFKSLDIADGDVLVDYGCGKGRVLLVAQAYPFRRLVGVELIPELAEIARRNLVRASSRCEIIEADARSIPLPDDATLIYLFSPFGSDVLAEVVSRIRESAIRRPRRIRVLTYAIQAVELAPLLGEPARTLSSDPLLQLYELKPESPSNRKYRR